MRACLSVLPLLWASFHFETLNAQTAPAAVVPSTLTKVPGSVSAGPAATQQPAQPTANPATLAVPPEAPALPARPVQGAFAPGPSSVARQGSVAGLPLQPTFRESVYLPDLQERQRYPDASDFIFDFISQVHLGHHSLVQAGN